MSFGKSTIAVLWMSGLGLLACSSGSSGGGGPAASDGGVGNDAQSTGDTGGSAADAAADGTSGGDAGPVLTMNGCSAVMYRDMSTASVSNRMVMMNHSGGGFDMPCMTISAAQSVMF